MKNTKQKGGKPSEYQPPLNFNETTTNNAGISSAFYDPIEVKTQKNVGDQENQIENQPAQNNSNASCLTLEYYQPFFDVRSIEVRNRILHSFFPVKSNFLEIISRNPDLYGPFWIYTTLIFAVAAAGNFSRYLKTDNKDNYDVDFNFVPVAASLIYGIGFIVPILVCFLMRFFGSEMKYAQVICIYGYSYSCFILVVFLCIIPNDGLELGLLIYGVANSTIFLLLNFWKELGNYIQNKRYLILGFVGGSQLVLFLTLKFYFFKTIVSS